MTSRFLRRRRYRLYPGELGEIAALVARGQVARGPAVAEFEAALAAYHGGGQVVTVNSGRVGLLFLLEALGLAPGDEILVPAYTLRALIEHVARPGVSWHAPEGGFFFWLHLAGANSDEVFDRAIAEKVAFLPGSAFYPDPHEQVGAKQQGSEFVRLCFTFADPDQIDEGCRRLARAL